MSILKPDNRENFPGNVSWALVTGASRGIGRAIAEKLAMEGWNLILTCSRTLPELRTFAERLEVQYSVEVKSISCDMGKPDAVRGLFRQINSLNLVVNNAGIAHIGLLQDMSDEEWDQILATNLSSVFYVSRAAIPLFLNNRTKIDNRTSLAPRNHLSEKGPDAQGLPKENETLVCGRIINISSVWGNVGASCEAAYSATKGGVNALTKALAKELAPSGIPVNAIACGCVNTAMNDNLNEQEKAQLADEIPFGRFAEPSEIADAVLHLVHAPAYLTGQIITMDGGWI